MATFIAVISLNETFKFYTAVRASKNLNNLKAVPDFNSTHTQTFSFGNNDQGLADLTKRNNLTGANVKLKIFQLSQDLSIDPNILC